MCLATLGIELLTTLPPTWAEVKEGSQLPGKAAVWSVERYDWSVPGTVTWTVKESNFTAPGSSVSAQVRPGSGGGSSIHVMWNRTGMDFKSRTLLWLVKLSGGKPLAVSIKQGLDKVLESERRPKAGITPGIKVEAAGATSRER